MIKNNLKKMTVALATFCSAILCMALIFNSCKKEDGNDVQKAKGVSSIVWYGDPDKAVAVDIIEQPSARKNASGTKITSNAHSADFPGIYFIWDSKQKDNGYLKVAASVFDQYVGFTLTSKESNTYWDFNIILQPSQQMTADNCYVFYIPKVYNNKNINMVFVSRFLETEKKIIRVRPHKHKEGCIETFTMVSGVVPDDKSYVVDPANNWRLNQATSGPAIKEYWNNAISAAYPTEWSEMANIKIDGVSASWIWDRQDSWAWGFEGSNIISTVYDIDINGSIVGNDIPFYFACDNAAVLFINGVRVHYTVVALDGFTVPTSEIDGFTNLTATGFNGDVWQHLYKVDNIKPYLNNNANNRIVICAANSDENNGRWNIFNNPAGLLYACKFSVNTCQ